MEQTQIENHGLRLEIRRLKYTIAQIDQRSAELISAAQFGRITGSIQQKNHVDIREQLFSIFEQLQPDFGREKSQYDLFGTFLANVIRNMGKSNQRVFYICFDVYNVILSLYFS